MSGDKLIEASKRGEVAEVQRLLNRGVDVNSKDSLGGTALIWASFRGHREVVQLLLEHGADPQHQSNNGDTALGWASSRGHREVVQLLLEHGADLQQQNKNGKTALDVAQTEQIKELLRRAAAEKAATEKAAAEKAAVEKAAAEKAATEKAATEKAAAEKAATEKAAAEKAATEKAAAEKAAATEKDVLEGEVVSRALAQGSKEWQRSKVMMVGQGRAGKTALSNAMVGRPFRDTESTVGINQLTCDIKHAALSAQGGGAEHDGDGKTVGSAWAECSRPERELEAAVAAIALSLSGAAAGTGCDTAARPHDQSLLSSLRQQKAASIEAARGLTLHGGGFAELEEGDRGGFAEVISSGSDSSSAADRGRSIHTLDVPSSKISAAAQTQQASHTAPLQPSLDVRSGASTAVAVAAPSPSSFPADVGEVDEALVMSLLGDVRSSTPGLLISLFDYGGQSVFDVIHHLFLTSNGVYALVFNMEWFVCAGTSTSTSTNDSKSTSDAHFPAEMERALRFMRSWLSSIAVHTFDAASGSTAPIVLVGTRLDVVKDPATHSRISTLLNQQFSDHVAWPSVLENTQARNADGRATHCFFPIDNTAAAGSDSMRQLMAVVERTIDSAAYTHKHVPLTWLRTMDKMHCSSSSGGGGKGEGEGQKQSCTSLKEVSACAVQCGMAEDEVPYFLSFLHDMGHLMWHDEPDLRDIVIFDAVRFLVEPATIIICKLNPDFNDETHHLVGSHKECQKKHKQKWGQLVRLGVLHTVLLDVMWRDFSAHREVLLALMVKFGLLVPLRRSFEAEAEAEGSNTVTNLEGTSQYLVPSVLSPVPSNDASLLDWTDDAYCSCFFVFTVTADLEHSPALTKADLATHGFLPTGLFERCVGEALSWAQSTSNQESFNIEDVAVLHKDLAIMMFGRQRFRLLLCNDINCIKVDIEGSSNPRTVQFRLLSLIKKIIDTCMKNLRCFTALVFETGDDDTESQRAKFQPSGQCSSIADGGMTDADMLIPLQQLRATVEGNSMLCWRGGRTLLTPEQVKGRYRVWLQLKELLDHYDVFISYRQCSYDSRLTLVLFDMFTNYVLGKDKRGVEVFLDTRRLQEGRPFDEDFSAALMCSTLAMPIVSHDALQRMIDHKSNCVDNVLLEWLLVQECYKAKRITRIYPVVVGQHLPWASTDTSTAPGNIIGDLFKQGSVGQLPETIPTATIAAAEKHMRANGLEPSGRLQSVTVKAVVVELLNFNGFLAWTVKQEQQTSKGGKCPLPERQIEWAVAAGSANVSVGMLQSCITEALNSDVTAQDTVANKESSSGGGAAEDGSLKHPQELWAFLHDDINVTDIEAVGTLLHEVGLGTAEDLAELTVDEDALAVFEQLKPFIKRLKKKKFETLLQH